MQDIDNLISDCINQISEKITGISFLEKLKYILIDNIKLLNQSTLQSIINKEQHLTNSDINFYIKIKKEDENISRIKHSIENDSLSVVIEGLKTISFYKKSNLSAGSLHFSKHTGVVLSKNTIIDESINKGTISLNIFIIDKEENIIR